MQAMFVSSFPARGARAPIRLSATVPKKAATATRIAEPGSGTSPMASPRNAVVQAATKPAKVPVSETAPSVPGGTCSKDATSRGGSAVELPDFGLGGIGERGAEGGYKGGCESLRIGCERGEEGAEYRDAGVRQGVPRATAPSSTLRRPGVFLSPVAEPGQDRTADHEEREHGKSLPSEGRVDRGRHHETSQSPARTHHPEPVGQRREDSRDDDRGEQEVQRWVCVFRTPWNSFAAYASPSIFGETGISAGRMAPAFTPPPVSRATPWYNSEPASGLGLPGVATTTPYERGVARVPGFPGISICSTASGRSWPRTKIKTAGTSREEGSSSACRLSQRAVMPANPESSAVLESADQMSRATRYAEGLS